MTAGRDPGLPIAAVLDDVAAAVRHSGLCVLQAPPGAGKTTQVPLALLPEIEGRILMLEPRRVAARAAAGRLAALLGEEVGGQVGYRMRGDSVPGTRVEVITDGILARMLQSDPELSGIGCVIFDEFHERALQADLGLALCLEVRGALRPDLALVVMSATLDAEPVAALLGDAPLVTSAGQSFPVETRWLDRPLGPGTLLGRDFIRAATGLARQALDETSGDVLVFLPGRGEIAQVGQALNGAAAEIVPLHGGLPFRAQQAALAPGGERRRVVLATAIAETSLTIPGVRVVVDCGRARRARQDPGNGMSRLVTERVSRAEADQRRGRAGRVAAGVCYRLWTRGEEGGLPAFPPAEIEVADLAPLALDLAQWGTAEPADLPFLTPPNPGAFAAARDLLAELGALDGRGQLTVDGQAMARLPVHPRLARMLLSGGPALAPLAALLDGTDPLLASGGPGPRPADLTLRLKAFHGPDKGAALTDARRQAKRLARLAPKAADLPPEAALALAYPDRIALRRGGETPRYLLSSGSGAVLDAGDPLAGQRLLVAADLDGDRRAARIRLALPIVESELRDAFAQRIETLHLCRWSRRAGEIEARVQERLGALALTDRAWTDAGDAERIPAILEGIRDLGLDRLNWTKAARALQKRAEWARPHMPDLPDMSDAGLLDSLEDWFAPYLAGVPGFAAARGVDLVGPLQARLGAHLAALDRAAPAAFTTPLGRKVPIDYGGEAPAIAVRLQEMFGVAEQPSAAGLPLAITLLSPAGRPVQTTQDLPGFWASSYADVRKDMRGRYPKHPWPEDPLAATPTTRTKPRG